MSLKSPRERQTMQVQWNETHSRIAQSLAKSNPKELFRFRASTTSFFIDEMQKLIQERQIYYPSQIQLNDPSDCRPVFRKRMSIGEYRKSFIPLSKEFMILNHEAACERGEITRTQLAAYKIAIKNLSLSDQIHSYRNWPSAYDKRTFDNIGVLSLASDMQNTVLWSLYAGNEKGVCIQLTNNSSNDPRSVPRQVDYLDSRPEIDFFGVFYLYLMQVPSYISSFSSRNQKHLLNGIKQLDFIYKKSKHWSYEREYRIVLFEGGAKYVPLREIEVKAIYIGSAVDEVKVDSIVMLRNSHGPSIRLYRASLASDSYGMAFREIS